MPMLKTKPKTAEKPKQRPRLQFHKQEAHGGPFIRLDAKAGKVKFAGVGDEDLMTSRPVVLHLDFELAEEGWIDFQSGEDFIGTDFDDPPPSAGKRDGAKWGLRVPVAMPYPITVDGVDIESAPEHAIRVTAAALIGAFEAIYGDWFEATEDSEEKIAVVRIDGWDRVGGGRNAIFAPRMELIGLAKELEEPIDLTEGEPEPEPEPAPKPKAKPKPRAKKPKEEEDWNEGDPNEETPPF